GAMENQAPVANFELKTDGLSVSAFNYSHDEDGELVSYAWDFGNGQMSSEMAPSWSYTRAGQYTVSLTVTDDKGATNTTTRTTQVEVP
uniref:PKD domain n=1 Tax=Vibrio anguillarum TaxID=55601 RepID=UPI000F62C196|nr:Chain A, PKD domain [Vibrio anguillarum]6AEM_B Chain B, PKD domain [Vibrio anguillarum]